MLIRISLIVGQCITAHWQRAAQSFTQVRGKITTFMEERDGYHTS